MFRRPWALLPIHRKSPPTFRRRVFLGALQDDFFTAGAGRALEPLGGAGLFVVYPFVDRDCAARLADGDG